MEDQEQKPAPKSRVSLIAAVRAAGESSGVRSSTTPQPPQSSQPSGTSSTTVNGSSLSTAPQPYRLQRTATTSTQGSGSNRSTPTIPDVPQLPGLGAVPLGGGVPKMKFRPTIPVKRVKQEVVKAEPSSSAPTRGAYRGRGGPRGGAPGRGGAARGGYTPAVSVAFGPLGGQRSAPTWSRTASSIPSNQPYDDVDVYSDQEEDGIQSSNIIDIGAISGLGESAPTSLIRAGRETGKAKGKIVDAKASRKLAKELRKSQRRTREKESQGKGKGKARDDVTDGDIEMVKTEPQSPEKMVMDLDQDSNGIGRLPTGFPGHRVDDAIMDEDMDQDRDEAGRRLRTGAVYAEADGDEDDAPVNTAQRVDLSESESEEEEGDMEGDFVPVEGLDDPSSKLYIFQFPHLFPHFMSKKPIDMTGANADVKPDVKPDIKPSFAQLNAAGRAGQAGKRKKLVLPPPPPGKVGSLVVMKSGRVKVVMGDDIVMNVAPGVPATFLQQLVHLDTPSKSTNVLGEVNKHFVVTPDIDRLLNDLWLNDGVTPGDKERERRKRREEDMLPAGLMKIEDD